MRVAAQRGALVNDHEHGLGKTLPLKAGGSITFSCYFQLLLRMQHDPFMAQTTHLVLDGLELRTVEADCVVTVLRALAKRRSALRVVLLFEESATSLRSAVARGGESMDGVRTGEGYEPSHAATIRRYLGEGGAEPIGQLIGEHEVQGELGRLEEEGVREQYWEELAPVVGAPLARVAQLELEVSRAHAHATLLDVVCTLVAKVLPSCAAERDGAALVIFVPTPWLVSAVCEALRATLAAAARVVSLCCRADVESLRAGAAVAGVQVLVGRNSEDVDAAGVAAANVCCVVDSGRSWGSMAQPGSSTPLFSTHFSDKLELWRRRRSLSATCKTRSYYCLLPRAQLAQLAQRTRPCVQRCSVEELALQIADLRLGRLTMFLSMLPCAPPATHTAVAVKRLQGMGALSVPLCAITPLGAALTKLGPLRLAPRLGKMLLMGSLLGAREDALSAVALLASHEVRVRDAGASRKDPTSASEDRPRTALASLDRWRELRGMATHADAAVGAAKPHLAAQWCTRNGMSEARCGGLANWRTFAVLWWRVHSICVRACVLWVRGCARACGCVGAWVRAHVRRDGKRRTVD